MWSDNANVINGGRTYIRENVVGEKRRGDPTLEILLAKKPKRVTIIDY